MWAKGALRLGLAGRAQWLAWTRPAAAVVSSAAVLWPVRNAKPPFPCALSLHGTVFNNLDVRVSGLPRPLYVLHHPAVET